MIRLSWVTLVLTLMACSATSPKKEMEEEKMIANTDESMTRGSWFNLSLSYDIGGLINKKIQLKKKLLSTIFGKKKSIKNSRALLDSATSPKKPVEKVKMMASTDESKARGSRFNIGSLIQHKIKKKKKLISTIFVKKKSIKNRRAVVDKDYLLANASQLQGKLFGIKSLIQKKIQNKKKLIIGEKKTLKHRRAVLDSASSPKEDIDEADMLTNTDTSSTIIGKKKTIKSRGSWFEKGKVIQKKIKNKKKLISAIFGKKKSIKNRRAVSDTSQTRYFSGIGSFFMKLSSFLPKPKIEMSIKFQ